MRFNRKKEPDRIPKLVSMINPKSPISEAFRTLRTNIQFASVDRTLKSIMITSTGPAEGKSTTIINLAIVLAQSDKKVLLVDADVRKPTVHHYLRMPNRIGLINLLIGTEGIEKAIQQTAVPNLSVLTSGPIPPNPAELLGSNRMEGLIMELEDEFDYILFDAPPVIAVTDAQLLSRYVDGVLMVINSGKTNRDMAVKAKSQLEKVNANVIGVVLNNRNVNKDYYYYYGAK